MGDQLDDLLGLDPVVERAVQVAAQLVRPAKRRQRGDSDEAAIAPGELRPLPDVAEDHLVGELRELGKQLADLVDGGMRSLGGHDFSGVSRRKTLSRYNLGA